VNSAQFAASVVASLSWPLVVLAALMTFRRPLSDLIGRVVTYKGLGHEVTFGDRLAAAESSVEDALSRSSAESFDSGRPPEGELGLSVREVGRNPSFVIIRAWEQVQDALAEVFSSVFPGEKRRTQPLSDLERKGIASPQYFTAVRALRELRNSVAHGNANPTAGEAIAYAESAGELARESRIIAQAVSGAR
jgi:hypothetical protein